MFTRIEVQHNRVRNPFGGRMKSTPLWPGKVCAMAVTSLNQASYRLSDPALMVWRMTEVTADGSRLVSATFTPALISCTCYFPALDEVFSAYWCSPSRTSSPRWLCTVARVVTIPVSPCGVSAIISSAG
jgi:hypothetical protein